MSGRLRGNMQAYSTADALVFELVEWQGGHSEINHISLRGTAVLFHCFEKELQLLLT